MGRGVIGIITRIFVLDYNKYIWRGQSHVQNFGVVTCEDDLGRLGVCVAMIAF